MPNLTKIINKILHTLFLELFGVLGVLRVGQVLLPALFELIDSIIGWIGEMGMKAVGVEFTEQIQERADRMSSIYRVAVRREELL